MIIEQMKSVNSSCIAKIGWYKNILRIVFQSGHIKEYLCTRHQFALDKLTDEEKTS